MYTFSDHPVWPLSEVEVFVGCVHNNHGAQTRRQRDNSIKLREHIVKNFKWLVKYIRQSEDQEPESDEEEETEDLSTIGETYSMVEPSFASVELALACLHVACMPRSANKYEDHHRNRPNYENLVSFRVVAAAVLRREMEAVIPGWTNANRKFRNRRM
jgi:hypothetical protein